MKREMKALIYKGHLIERVFPSGYYSCFLIGKGFLRADTLQGLKQLIKETLKPEGLCGKKKHST